MNTPRNREKRLARPSITARLPALSPAFVSADDAARFAHRLIGDFRSAEYGGVILKDAQGFYYATRPVKGKTGAFDPTLVISTNLQGHFIQPSGYTCYALYHSHPDNYDALKRGFGRWTESQVHIAVNFFSNIDVLLNSQNAYFARVHYLSGVNGSLIKYVASGSARERALAVRIGEDSSKGILTFNSAVGFVEAAAAAGDLSVVQSSEVWDGKLGVLGADYRPFTPKALQDIAPVIIAQPAFGPTFSSAELALKDVRARIHQTSESLYGVILKRKGVGFFVASEPVTGETDFALQRIFGRDTAGRLRFPEQFDLIGVYCSDGFYRDPSLMPAEEVSIFKNFVYPQTLAKGIEAVRSLAGVGGKRSLALYISTRDGALLKYVSTFAAREQKFLARLPEGEGQGLAILRDMLGGVYKTTTCIRELAGAGELSVLHSSDLWRSEGRVDAGWEPYEGFYRRDMGPSFVTPDDAARYAHKQIASRTASVYGGLIYQRLDNRFVATEPLKGKNETFDASMVYPAELARFVPAGCSVVAVYHSHRVHPLQLWRSKDEEKLFRNMLEPHEVYDAIRNRDWAAIRYFSAQDGALLKYTPSGSLQEALLGAQLAPLADHPERVRHNTMAMAMRGNSKKPSEYIALVAKTGDLQLVVGSALWGSPGKITDGWRPGIDSGQAVQPPALSPVFAQSEDAVRHIHEQMGARQSGQYGLVLRSTHSEEYVTTLALEGGDFSMDRLYQRDDLTGSYKLPAGFKPLAVYVAAPGQIDLQGHLPDKRVYEGFISPLDLVKGLQLAINLQSQTDFLGGNSVLYISTADGALLRFASALDATQLSAGIFKNAGQVLLDQLTARRLTPVEYVRKVAMAGRLEVLVTNGVWAHAGPVSGGWQPFGAQVGGRPERSIRQFPASPVFSYPNDAARYVHGKIKQSHTLNILGGILHHPAYNTYVALDPVVNGEPVNVAETLLETHRVTPGASSPRVVLPEGFKLASLYFSRDMRNRNAAGEVETLLLRNIPWPEDICYATHTLDLRGLGVAYLYVSTDDGGLLRYWRGSQEARFQLCNTVIGDGWSALGYFEENSQATPVNMLPSDMLTHVLNSGGMHVLVTSSSWPLAGIIASGHTVRAQPEAFDYEGTTPGLPVADLKVGPLRDEL